VPNVVRADFDRLKATLTNCARLGPESQNREGHAEFRAHLESRETLLVIGGSEYRSLTVTARNGGPCDQQRLPSRAREQAVGVVR